MSSLPVSRFVCNVLRLDGLVSAASGALMAVGGVWLAPWLRLPAVLLVTAGIGCLVYGGVLLWLARRSSLPRGVMWTVIAGNVGWAAGCLALAGGFLVAPTLIGQAFLAVQALAVLLFAELQFMSLRRPAREAMAHSPMPRT